MDSGEEQSLSKTMELLDGMFVFVAVLAGLVLSNAAVLHFYTPDIDGIVDRIARHFIKSNVELLTPEPVERLQYALSLLAAPLLILISWLLVERASATPKARGRARFAYVAGVALASVCSLSLAALAAGGAPGVALLGRSLPVNPYVFVFAIVPGIFICALWAGRSPRAGYAATIISRIFSLVLLVLLGVSSVIDKGSWYAMMPHFEAMFYAVTQAFSGKTLLVDYANQYGLYPHFLVPVFKVTELSVFKFSLVMSVLLCVSLYAVYAFLELAVSNRVVSFIGFISVLFVAKYRLFLEFSDPYFQYFPLRTVFACLLVWMGANYLKRGGRALYCGVSALSCLAVLWNFDTGLVVLLTWLLLLLYEEAARWTPGNTAAALGRSVRHVAVLAAFLAGVLALHVAFAYFRAGTIPDYSGFVRYQQIFYMSGFYMMPIPAVGAWLVVVLVYLAGLVHSLGAVVRRRASVQEKVIFMISILGLGLFSYYQGRSHEYVIGLCSYPAIMLMTIYADILLRIHNECRFKLVHGFLWSFVLVAVLSISVCALAGRFTDVVHKAQGGLVAFGENPAAMRAEKDIQFVRDRISSGEEIVVLGHAGQSHYYGELNARSPLEAASLVESILVEDEAKYEEFINSSRPEKVFLSLTSRRTSGVYKALLERYAISEVSESGRVAILERKGEGKAPSEGAGVFMPEEDMAWHYRRPLFSNEHDSLIYNHHYGPRISFNGDFTVQVLLKPGTPQTDYAAVIGNHRGNLFQGFVIQQAGNIEGTYSLTIGNGKAWIPGPQFRVPPDKWSYLVVTVGRETVEVWLDGEIVTAMKMDGQMDNSVFEVMAGDVFWGGRQFNGTIREAMVSASVLSPGRIRENWDVIKAADLH